MLLTCKHCLLSMLLLRLIGSAVRDCYSVVEQHAQLQQAHLIGSREGVLAPLLSPLPAGWLYSRSNCPDLHQAPACLLRSHLP